MYAPDGRVNPPARLKVTTAMAIKRQPHMAKRREAPSTSSTAKSSIANRTTYKGEMRSGKGRRPQSLSKPTADSGAGLIRWYLSVRPDVFHDRVVQRVCQDSTWLQVSMIAERCA